MRKQLIQKLKEPKQQQIRFFYATESGIRAWGVAPSDSNYDIRFLYYHRPEWYFSIRSHQDSITEMSHNRLLDVSGWELKKALILLYKENSSLYEWVHGKSVYLQTEKYPQFSRLTQDFYDPKAVLFSDVSFANQEIFV